MSEEAKKVVCCQKYRYMGITQQSIDMDAGFGIKIVLRHTEDPKETNILYCPECGKDLELLWEERKK